MPFSLRPERMITAIFSILALMLTAPAASAESGPAPASRPLTSEDSLNLSDSDRCPVCAMFPARQPQAAAAMTLKSGETYYFCSNGCLLRAWLRPTVYLGKMKATIDRLVVLDYFSGKPIDARRATWVAGSDVVGPMGPAIVTLGDAGQLAAFKKRHGGQTIFHLHQLDDALWRKISQRKLPES